MKIVKIGNALLRKKSSPLLRQQLRGRKLKAFLRQMVSAMRKAQGVGLAANQIGSPLRAFVMECHGNKRYPKVKSFALQAYLNARIVDYSKAKEKGWEGCLSIPGYRGLVPRSKRVILEALTADGRKFRKTFRGFEARVVQHEVDHLNGFFYIDRMGTQDPWLHLEEFNQHFGKKVKDRK